jgi:hypothetical protein
MKVDYRKRNEKGQLMPEDNSLHPKVIGVRISKSSYPKLIALAQSRNLRPTELARLAIEEYLKEYSQES